MNKRLKLFTAILLVCMLIFSSASVSALVGNINPTNLLANLFSDLERNLQVDTIIDPLLEQALLSNNQVEVIVTFWGDNGITARHLELLDAVGIQVGVAFQSLPIVGVRANANHVATLAALPQVRSLYFNEELQYENFDETSLTGVKRVLTESEFTRQNNGRPIAGQGITVLVNDSGIDGTHRDLPYGTKVIQNVLGTTNLNAQSSLLPVTYTENIPNTDTASHGTHVAGTVGGLGVMSGGKYEGVAPGVNIVGYGSGAALFILDTLGGFDYALTHQLEYNIRVVTNSFGSTGDVGTDFNPHHPTNVATKKLYDRGVAIVFSAGNSGPGESTITGNFKKAPWVITVAAGDKDGKLANFSSRGVEGKGGQVVINGRTFNWEDRPTVTAPGVRVVSTRAYDALTPLGLEDDIATLDPAHVPYYTIASGTSMAAPHVAGIIALLLSANPSLSPDEVKAILQETATNIPGRAAWEVGAGYVNAYAAVDKVLNGRTYGSTLNMNRSFNSSVYLDVQRENIEIDYTTGTNGSIPYTVHEGLTELAVTVYGRGFVGSGNPINLVLIDPNGQEYSSGISLLFPLFFDRTVVVPSPIAGEWTIEIRGLRGDTLNPIGLGLPEKVAGVVTTKRSAGYTGLSDIQGHANQDAIISAVHNRLVDGFSNGRYRPEQALKREDLANYLMMGMGIRQYLPVNGSVTFTDVSAALRPFAEAVGAQGGAIRDGYIRQNPVMFVQGSTFSPKANVTREEIAYTLVQSLGLQQAAQDRNQELGSNNITLYYGSNRIVLTDTAQINPSLRGYVEVAFDLGLLTVEDFFANNMHYELENGEIVFYASFNPGQSISRGEYAVFANRTYAKFLE